MVKMKSIKLVKFWKKHYRLCLIIFGRV